jgi:prophage regulatory protein
MQEMLGLKAVVAATGISRATIYVLMSEGAFPRPRRVGKRAVRWNSSEIQAIGSPAALLAAHGTCSHDVTGST